MLEHNQWELGVRQELPAFYTCSHFYCQAISRLDIHKSYFSGAVDHCAFMEVFPHLQGFHF
jgi:hypothetical protein